MLSKITFRGCVASQCSQYYFMALCISNGKKKKKKTLQFSWLDITLCLSCSTIILIFNRISRPMQQDLKLFWCKTREEVVQLIKVGAKVNTRHSDDTTPLMVHAERGNSDLVRELLLHNAHVDLQDEVSSDYESFPGSVDDVHVCGCG